MPSPGGTSRRPWGRLTTDRRAVNRLLANPLVTESSLFSHEHGVQALLPFIAHYCPRALIVPIAIRQLQPAGGLGGPGPDPDPPSRSGYPPGAEHGFFPLPLTRGGPAPGPGDPAGLERRRPPGGSEPQRTGPSRLPGLPVPATSPATAGFRRRSPRSSPTAIPRSTPPSRQPRTTSYIVQLYSAEPLHLAEAQSYFFGGDAFFGRQVATRLATPESREALKRQVLGITGEPTVDSQPGRGPA